MEALKELIEKIVLFFRKLIAKIKGADEPQGQVGTPTVSHTAPREESPLPGVVVPEEIYYEGSAVQYALENGVTPAEIGAFTLALQYMPQGITHEQRVELFRNPQKYTPQPRPVEPGPEKFYRGPIDVHTLTAVDKAWLYQQDKVIRLRFGHRFYNLSLYHNDLVLMGSFTDHNRAINDGELQLRQLGTPRVEDVSPILFYTVQDVFYRYESL